MIHKALHYRTGNNHQVPWLWCLLMLCFLSSSCLTALPAQAVENYQIPAGVDAALQSQLQASIQSSMDRILQKIETNMSSAMDPLIPQMASMVSQSTAKMSPQINQLATDVIQPSIKVHVEEQAKVVGSEINSIISSALAGWDGQSDPTPIIKSAIASAIPRIKQAAMARADEEQKKDYETIKPKVEAIIQTELDATIPEMQKLVSAKLQESVPPTQQIVEADINSMIVDLESTLPDDQKQLLESMRPQFEAAARAQIQEALFDAVSVKIDAKVVGGMEASTKQSIQAIVGPMNQACTDYATAYAKSILPSQVDQMGLRPQIESMIDEIASEHVTVFEERINAGNEELYQKKAAAINEVMHNFVKTQVMAILSGTSAPASDTTTPTTTTTTPASNSSAPANSALVTVNGQQLNFKVAPVVVQGRTLVPLRAIFESLGVTVSWDDASRTVTATKNGVVITLPVGKTEATKNGQPVTLDVPATIVDGSTMVPVRFVSESLGASVDWNATTRTVTINSK